MPAVLLVEPDAPLRAVYRGALQSAGHDVTAVRTAAEAIAAADATAPDIVLIELQLAGHSGVEFLYEFRSYAEWRRIPIIIHSRVPDADTERAAVSREIGIAQYLYKPDTSLAALVRAVHLQLAVPR